LFTLHPIIEALAKTNDARKEKVKTMTLNNEIFEATITGSAAPVLVDFWAEWCGPCKMIAPVLNELAAEQDGKAVIAKLNIDEAPELAARFGITAIPTLILFKNGQPAATLRGVQSKSAILKSLASA
jgi:thioredoxin 1